MFSKVARQVINKLRAAKEFNAVQLSYILDQTWAEFLSLAVNICAGELLYKKNAAVGFGDKIAKVFCDEIYQLNLITRIHKSLWLFNDFVVAFIDYVNTDRFLQFKFHSANIFISKPKRSVYIGWEMRNLILSVYYKAEIFHKEGCFSGNFGAKESHDMNLPGNLLQSRYLNFLLCHILYQ